MSDPEPNWELLAPGGDSSLTRPPLAAPRSPFGQRAALLFLFVGSMWAIRIVDTFRSYGSIAGDGIVPRTTHGLLGIATAPFIHASWGHLLANTIPLLVLGALLLAGGVAEFVFVTVVSAVVAGAGTWLFGETARHIGASSLVFGYIGYLLVRPAFDRKLWSIVITLVVAGLYGATLLWSIIPQGGTSWSGHIFGFIGGVLAATAARRGARA